MSSLTRFWRISLTIGSALAVAGIVGTSADPARASTPQPVTISTSYYVAGAAGADLKNVLYNDGELQAAADCDNEHPTYSDDILDFGAQLLPGSSQGETESVDDQHYYSESQIEAMAESFAEGYAVEDEACVVASKGELGIGSTAYLEIGTNNAGPTPTAAQAKTQANSWWTIDSTAAEDYYNWANAQPGLDAAGIQLDVLMSGSSDMELGSGYNHASATLPWAYQMSQEYDPGNMDSYPPDDYGSADGCYNPNGPLTGSFVCSTGWTVKDVYKLIVDTFPDPQIYLAPPNGEQPQEWAQLCVYYATTYPGGSTPFYGGTDILSEPTGGSGYLSTAASWTDIIDALQGSGNSNCQESLPAFETNFDEEATPGGNVTWP